MNKKVLNMVAFILVAIVQLSVPAMMVVGREKVLSQGKEFKFKTIPVDPNDPFRGKYIVLDYEIDTVVTRKKDNWKAQDNIYIILAEDSKGFASILEVSKSKPANTTDYVQATISRYQDNSSETLNIDYPFDRFYMEESKAYDAELTYNQSAADTSKVTYALINVKDGEAVIKDVLIDEVSVIELVKAQHRK